MVSIVSYSHPSAFNQEKALVGAFSVIVQPVVEPMKHYTALILYPLSIGLNALNSEIWADGWREEREGARKVVIRRIIEC